MSSHNGTAITIIIPAYNEEKRLGATISSLREMDVSATIAVVDDGSTDDTVSVAKEYADIVLQMPKNGGKGRALTYAWKQVPGDIIMFVDADLEGTAQLTKALLPPIIEDMADMTIAAFPPAQTKGGFGFVKRLATNGILEMTGQHFRSPISGQRAVRRQLLEAIGGLSEGWGIEVALTIDAVRKGFRVKEVVIPLKHRETGRDIKGFIHRGKQFVQIAATPSRKRRENR